MKWTFLYTTLIVIGIIKCCACSDFSRKTSNADAPVLDTSYKTVRYDTAILSIDQKTLDIETWDALFYSKQFTNLYEHSAWYIVDASNFLSSETFTERQKIICLCSLQSLSIDKYIPILRRCDNLFNAGKISESLLSWSVAPNFSNHYLVVRNYTNEQVKEVLNNLLQNNRVTSKFKDMIKSILSGDLWDNIK
jgi:hypothetical protein